MIGRPLCGSKRKKAIKHIHKTLVAITVIFALVISRCSRDAGTGENQDSGSLTMSQGEHNRDEHGREGQGEHDHREEGQESGTEFALNQTYNVVQNGARLILAYDAQSNSFIGTVENSTDKTLKQVRIEVHLSNGKEIGPTTLVDLAPGQKRDVKLMATTKGFVGWTAHSEVGSGEPGHGE